MSHPTMVLPQTELGSDGWVPYGGTSPPKFKSYTWHGCLHLPGFIPGLFDVIRSVVGDVLVNSFNSKIEI
jgi:hypothetical protein